MDDAAAWRELLDEGELAILADVLAEPSVLALICRRRIFPARRSQPRSPG